MLHDQRRQSRTPGKDAAAAAASAVSCDSRSHQLAFAVHEDHSTFCLRFDEIDYRFSCATFRDCGAEQGWMNRVRKASRSSKKRDAWPSNLPARTHLASFLTLTIQSLQAKVKVYGQARAIYMAHLCWIESSPSMLHLMCKPGQPPAAHFPACGGGQQATGRASEQHANADSLVTCLADQIWSNDRHNR